MSFLIRVRRPFGPLHHEAGGVIFSTEIDRDQADALLCEWDVDDELFSFSGPSAWFTAEPRENPRMGVLTHTRQVDALSRARPGQLLYPAHPDPRFRVPHMTHWRTGGRAPTSTYDGPRRPMALAVIRNNGGPPRDRWRDLRLRNRFATAKGVDLFGPEWAWSSYKPRRFWPARRPPGYRGDAEQAYQTLALDEARPAFSWRSNEVKIALLSRYHSAICLENTVEPHYFSEKIVDGVLAGCVPIYRAHPTVRQGILRGARWVDPGDFGLSVRRTLAHARSLDRREVAEQNRVWLESDEVQATSVGAVWDRIADILREAHLRQETKA